MTGVCLLKRREEAEGADFSAHHPEYANHGNDHQVDLHQPVFNLDKKTEILKIPQNRRAGSTENKILAGENIRCVRSD